jgi:hypothetical protein
MALSREWLQKKFLNHYDYTTIQFSGIDVKWTVRLFTLAVSRISGAGPRPVHPGTRPMPGFGMPLFSPVPLRRGGACGETFQLDVDFLACVII